MDSNLALIVSFTGFMLSIKLSLKFTQRFVKLRGLFILLTDFIFCSNSSDIFIRSREPFFSVKFRIDIMRSAGFTPLSVRQQRKAIKHVKF